jgi:hypothetical protein
VAERLLAIQAQDPRAARLAFRARSPDLDAAGVDGALATGALVVSWLCRGTLHMVRSEDYPWLLGLTAPIAERSGARRLAQLGIAPGDAERALRIVADALAGGPMTRAELAEPLAAAGIETAGQAMPHLLALAARRGLVVRGPLRDRDWAFALTSDWLGIEPPAPLAGGAREPALAELARRYLAGHGPASAADLASWSGLGLRDARAGIRSIAGELAGADSDRDLLDLVGRDPAPERIAPRLLGPFDPFLLGWRDRAHVVDDAYVRRVHPGGGMIRAVATIDGRAVGTWTQGPAGVEIEPFEGSVGGEFDDEISDVARFRG